MIAGRYTRIALFASIVLLLGAGIAGCRRSSPSTVARLTANGRAEVTRPGENSREVTTSRNLRIGDRVRVREGTADIRLDGDQRLQLRLGSDVELRTAPASAPTRRSRPALLGGDLLVTSAGGSTLVDVSTRQVAVTGVARISSGIALLAATYQGSAVLTSEGRSITVPALRQAAISAVGTFPQRPSPLEYSPSDAWDQRYLSDAIALGNELAARSQGFSAQFASGEGRTAAFFKSLFPRLAAEPGFDAPLVNALRPPGETLVGAAITLEGTRGSFAERWAAVFGFRDEGAPWGLVALDQGVSRVPLLDAVTAAIGRSPTTFAEGQPGSGPSSLPPPGGGSTPTTAPPRPTTSTTAPRGRPGTSTTTPAPVPPPGPPSPTGPLNTGAPIIDDTINSLVDTLTGLLRSLGQ